MTMTRTLEGSLKNCQRFSRVVCLSLLATFLLIPGYVFAQSKGQTNKTQAHTTWREYGGSPDGAQYSALRQINRTNVNKLKVAWTFKTGDDKGYYFNPLIVDGVMYVLAKNNSIVALDATTGKELWAHQNDAQTPRITHRGMNFWQNADGSDRRLLFSVDNYLLELDARTGQPVTQFGKNGRIDLREGLGRDVNSFRLVQSSNPGRVFEDLIILGSSPNEEYESAPGDIRAYNILTGSLVWTFHTIPHPGEVGYETWPKDAWKTVGGANAWSGMALDEKRGVIYIPTASPKYNFYGADRIGADLFGNCLLALNARTGKLVWYFQMVHHDIWDYDNGTPPMLATVRHDGKMVDVVAQATKVGFVWVFNRDTGKPLWPVEERAVPKSQMPGEEAWPTQPFPSKPPPFARQAFTANDLNPYMDAAETEQFRKELLSAHNEGLFTPPGLENTVEMPGNNGGANFGGAAVDPANGYFYVVSKDLPAMLKLELAKAVPRTGSPAVRGHAIFEANCSLCHGSDLQGKPPAIPSLVDVVSRLGAAEIRNTVGYGKGAMPSFSKLTSRDVDALLQYLSHPEQVASSPTAEAESPKASADDPTGPHYKSGFGFMFASSGLPAIKPPWTTLTAYDLNSGTIRWKIPLGEVPELAAKGITDTGSHFPKANPVVTAGGLIFTGTRDRKVRAIDSATGKVLWESELDAALEGMPAIYEVKGRQYVVFCAAARATTHTHNIPGHPASTDPIQGAYVAFALPAQSAK